MSDAAQHHAGQLVIIALGPLTNLAVALQRHPDLAANGECHLACRRASTAHQILAVCFGMAGHSCVEGVGTCWPTYCSMHLSDLMLLTCNSTYCISKWVKAI